MGCVEYYKEDFTYQVDRSPILAMSDSMISLACCESPVETGSAARSLLFLGSGEGVRFSSSSRFRFEGVCAEADNDVVAGE